MIPAGQGGGRGGNQAHGHRENEGGGQVHHVHGVAVLPPEGRSGHLRQAQAILEELRPLTRLRKVNELLAREAEVLSFEQELEGKIRREMGEVQRDHIIREQIRLLQQELGEDEDTELTEYRMKIDALKLTEEARAKLLKEVDRLAKQPYSSAEASVIRNYLDVCLEMPWNTETRERVSVDAARKVLEKDHFGLEKVKERILEFIAVRQINPDAKGQIICLVGPPGTGKTSIARSVAASLNKKYVRICLGGIRDEAEIRGHRKTYVGAMPGRIVNAVRQAGVKNPLLLLDEIDKVGNDYKGDPGAALLEVLDGEQNDAFRDHYVEIPIDLSEVLFIATANTTETIPKPLLDRMEMIEINSYTANEKFHIAREHLVKKELHRNGIRPEEIGFTDEALYARINRYTREAGVRGLKRQISAVCRKEARHILEKRQKCTAGEYMTEMVNITEDNLEDYLGKPKYSQDRIADKDEVGIVRGLAWTSAGGDTLQIEVNMMPGGGEVDLTGQMGDVMKESARIAMSYVRSVGERYQIEEKLFRKKDFHIHIPEGAVPKDGPSAGITMATAILSAVTGKAVRADVAMTGEVTLRGRVLPIGGLKEKILAAKTAGVHTVLVPKENEKDIAELDREITDGLEIHLVQCMDEVAGYAFC